MGDSICLHIQMKDCTRIEPAALWIGGSLFYWGRVIKGFQSCGVVGTVILTGYTGELTIQVDCPGRLNT